MTEFADFVWGISSALGHEWTRVVSREEFESLLATEPLAAALEEVRRRTVALRTPMSLPGIAAPDIQHGPDELSWSHTTGTGRTEIRATQAGLRQIIVWRPAFGGDETLGVGALPRPVIVAAWNAADDPLDLCFWDDPTAAANRHYMAVLDLGELPASLKAILTSRIRDRMESGVEDGGPGHWCIEEGAGTCA